MLTDSKAATHRKDLCVLLITHINIDLSVISSPLVYTDSSQSDFPLDSLGWELRLLRFSNIVYHQEIFSKCSIYVSIEKMSIKLIQ